MTGKNFKITAEIVNGICPTCDEYTPLVGITKQMDKVLVDIEKLKDANRDLGYTNGAK